MKKQILHKPLLFILMLFLTSTVIGQISFSNSNASLKRANFKSGGPVTVIDWNNDGRDDIVRMEVGHKVYVEIQRADGNFDSLYIADFGGSSGWAWAMAVADVDANGYKDIIAGGSGAAGVKLMKTNALGLMGSIVALPSSVFFLQNLTLADFNNDGQIDIFACDDNAQSHIYINSGGTFTHSPSVINFDVTTTDDSGNYGSVWTDFDNDGDFDLYIAKCRQSVTSPSDGRRINVMFRNDGGGVFTESAATYGLAIGWQSWTAAFGDIDNDGDQDLMLTNHDHESQILRNDGTGHFTDITALTLFDITDITPIQSVMEDFDNDGFVDIFVTGSSSRMYRNTGTGTFTRVNGLFDANDMLSFAIGDLNHDGFIDMYSSYGNIYVTPSTSINDVVWKNEGNANHFITLHLEGVASNKDAIGSKVKIYGAWGVQVREVKCGESYGTINTGAAHFGLGTATHIDSVTIAWPSGANQTIVNPSIDQFITVKEGGCVSPEAIITASGPLVICTGSSVTLTAPAGYTYLWSDGSTNQTLIITTPGDYSVEVTELGNACVGISNSLYVGPPPAETIEIAVTGDLTFCAGGSVTLNATEGYSHYTWTSSSDTTASTSITSSGTYTVTINGVCEPFTSAPVSVTVITPVAPTSTNVTFIDSGSTTLNATGTNVTWFSDAAGTSTIETGASFTTPMLTDTTTYYMQTSTSFGGAMAQAGKMNASGAGYSGSTATNALTYFDVLKSSTLKTVKVYTNLAGTRKFELRDNMNALLNSTTVAVAVDSQVITLNWTLLPGVNYTISTDSVTNKAIAGWGFASPKLKRHTSGVSYPYLASDLLSITNSSFGTGFYYYFYDWNVQAENDTCYSALVPVTVFVNPQAPNSISSLESVGLSVYPNPASNNVFIDNIDASNLMISLTDITGKELMHQATNSVKTSLDISKFAAGVYAINIIKNEQKITYKLVIQ
jgi:hypothetical protein